jgi:hypothetical protein
VTTREWSILLVALVIGYLVLPAVFGKLRRKAA